MMFSLVVRPILFVLVLMSAGCTDDYIADLVDQDDEPNPPSGEVSSEVPAVFQAFAGRADVTLDGDYVVIRSNGVPDHGSPYFESSDTRYEAYDGTNADFHLNPNRIASQDLVFRIPVTPRASSSPQSTPMGPMGVSLNGVPFYNQYAAGSAPLTREINSFDQYNGHPQQFGGYHYHIEPLYLTETYGRDALLGYLLDGFPVYGPVENGREVGNGDLDAYHGHTHATAEYPEGIYHYHVTAEDPYINGAGFYGVAGTVSQ
ncbi:MAG: YHYH protein [Bacteroidota bacterium]